MSNNAEARVEESKQSASPRKKALLLIFLALLILFVSAVLLLVWLPSPAEGQVLRFTAGQQWCIGGSFAAGIVTLTFAVFRFVVGGTGGIIGLALKLIGMGVLVGGLGIGLAGGLFLWAALSTEYHHHESGGGFDWDD